MINLEDEIIFKFDESCTKEEAVGKMLGWMRGHKRLKFVELNKFRTGVEEKFLPYITHLMFPLDEQVTAITQVVWNELMDIVDAADVAKKIGDEVEYHSLEEKYCVKADQFDKCKKDAEDSVKYQLAITEEFSKGKDSLIIKDQLATEKTGELYFTIASLDFWARTTFGVSVENELVDNDPKLSGTNLSVKHLLEVKDLSSAITSDKDGYQRNNAFSFVLEEILIKNPNAKPARVLSELKLKKEDKFRVIKDVSGKGVTWINGNKEEEFISVNNLGERIRYWKREVFPRLVKNIPD